MKEDLKKRRIEVMYTQNKWRKERPLFSCIIHHHHHYNKKRAYLSPLHVLRIAAKSAEVDHMVEPIGTGAHLRVCMGDNVK